METVPPFGTFFNGLGYYVPLTEYNSSLRAGDGTPLTYVGPLLVARLRGPGSNRYVNGFHR